MRFFLALALASLTQASPLPEGCGEYEIWGRIASTDKAYELVVNEGSKSETRLELPPTIWIRAATHEKHYVRAKGKLEQELKAYRGSFQARELSYAVPDPLRGERIGYHRLKAAACLDSERRSN